MTINAAIKLTEEDVLDIISSAICGGIGYWCCINNGTIEWDMIRAEQPDATIDEKLYYILAKGQSIVLINTETDEEYILTHGKLKKGIRLAIDKDYWSGDMDDVDAEIADIIFQCALFEDIMFS